MIKCEICKIPLNCEGPDSFCEKCKTQSLLNRFLIIGKDDIEIKNPSDRKDFTLSSALKNRADPNQTIENRNYRKQRNPLRNRYKLTVDEYNQMLITQNKRCAICNTDTPKGQGRFHIDHCHESGKIRGLLCHACNIGLGHFKDNPESMIKAANYIISSREE